MSSCIEFNGAKDDDGYGVVTKNKKYYRLHRWTYEQEYGPIPKGMVIMHTCDNPSCYNIDHLKIGTHQDNMIDCHNKNRNPRYRLKKPQVLEIRKKYPSMTQQQLADYYNVHINTIYAVVNRHTWKHI